MEKRKNQSNKNELINTTLEGIEKILDIAIDSSLKMADDLRSKADINYEIHSMAAYNIAAQVLILIKTNNMKFAKIGYNHLRGKFIELREGFSQEYISLIEELETELIGPNSDIIYEAKIRGGINK